MSHVDIPALLNTYGEIHDHADVLSDTVLATLNDSSAALSELEYWRNACGIDHVERIAKLVAERERMEPVIIAAIRYWCAYFDKNIDKCPTPWSSGAHEDHDCVVSLRSRMHMAISYYIECTE